MSDSSETQKAGKRNESRDSTLAAILDALSKVYRRFRRSPITSNTAVAGHSAFLYSATVQNQSADSIPILLLALLVFSLGLLCLRWLEKRMDLE